MSSSATHFKVGAFVLTAVALGVGGTILLGAQSLFQTTETLETYSTESVDGLTVGSPVKFRGVTIGSVSEITFVNLVYGRQPTSQEHVLDSMVLIRMKVLDQLIGVNDEVEFNADVIASVKAGLRAQLVSAGITGGLYLQFIYSTDSEKLVAAPTWTPAYPYVPAMPSRLNELLDGIEAIVQGIKGVEFTTIGLDVRTLVQNLNLILEGQGKPVLSDLTAFIEEARATNKQVQGILADPNIQKSLANIQNASESLASVLGDGQTDLKTTIARLPAIAASLASGSAELDSILKSPELHATLANLNNAATAAPATIEEARALLARVDQLIASEEYDIRVLMQSLREMAENLDALSQRLRQDAPQVLFAAPPPRLAPGAPLPR